MSAQFSIDIEWIASEISDPVEQATSAEISIRVGDHHVTEVEDRRAKSVRSTIRASASLLASWLLANWWRLRWEPYKDPGQSSCLDWRLSHDLPAVGGGYVWPPLTFTESDGARILLTCDGQAKSDPEDRAPVRYLNSFTEFVDATSFESSVMSFVDSVLARLHLKNIKSSALQDLFSEILAEKQNPAQNAQRKLEALLGLDPDENQDLIVTLLKDWKYVGSGALEEIAAAMSSTGVNDALIAARDAAQTVKDFAEISDFKKIREWSSAQPPLAAAVPWQLGREAAYAVRKLWNFGTAPITTQEMAARLQLPPSRLGEGGASVPFSLAVRNHADEKVAFIFARHHPRSIRFDAARLIGDHAILSSQDQWMPATRSMTFRQKFQRAFAAEFLCPSEVLIQEFPSPISLDDQDEVTNKWATKYDVSEQIVVHHLANRRLLQRSDADLRLFG